MTNVQHWFNSTLGQQVLETETSVIEQLLPAYFGYHLLQLSMQSRVLYDSSPIGHKFKLGHGKLEEETVQPSLAADSLHLPFETDSIDVVLMHHMLEFHANPLSLLRETARIALPTGHLVIVGFNPISLWGLCQPMGRFRNSAPWHGDFISPGRLMDWLNLLNFKIDRAQYCIYGPPSERFTKPLKHDFSQGLSRKTNWPFGAVYVIVARKQVGSMIPMRPVWNPRHAFGQLSVVPAGRPATGRHMPTRNIPEGD